VLFRSRSFTELNKLQRPLSGGIKKLAAINRVCVSSGRLRRSLSCITQPGVTRYLRPRALVPSAARLPRSGVSKRTLHTTKVLKFGNATAVRVASKPSYNNIKTPYVVPNIKTSRKPVTFHRLRMTPRQYGQTREVPPIATNLTAEAAAVTTSPTVFPGPKFTFPFPSFNDSKVALSEMFDTHTVENKLGNDVVHIESKQRAFYVNDLGIVKQQYQRWTRNLPTARPFYAMKCNPDPILVQLLANQGAGFDCASAAEIEQALSTGVKPEDIIFANPIKNAQSLQYAASVGVNKMTFDNADELHKIHAHHPKGELVLRILADDSHSLMRFGTKFGAPFESVEGLFRLAKQLNLKVIGIAFHIGSGCFSTKAHSSAVALARSCFDMAERVGLPRLSLLDVGGGFPGDTHVGTRPDGSPGFEEMAATLRSSFAEYFPADEYKDLRIIGEPGRYFAKAWATLFTHVVGKREVPLLPPTQSATANSTTATASAVNNNKVPALARGLHTEMEKKPRFLYYINDGVYGSFNCLIFDHAVAQPIPAKRFLASVGSTSSSSAIPASLPEDNKSAASSVSSLGTFFGPTCDSMDVVAKDIEIEELSVGDWVAFEHMGAYTSAAATRFNGIELPERHYIDTMPSVKNVPELSA